MGCGCCTEQGGAPPKTAPCPRSGSSGRRVSRRTLQHQITTPWKRALPDQGYYFCADPQCDVVYFAEDGSTITRAEMRGPVGQKSRDEQRTICYCFDITEADVLAARQGDGTDPCRDYVIEQTRASVCDCETRNPSGRCCLGDFPAWPGSRRRRIDD